MQFGLALLALLVLVQTGSGSKRRKGSDWSNIKWDELEEEWREGDAEEELITEDELMYREMERRREAGPQARRARLHCATNLPPNTRPRR
jgi:hypothetical protein